MWQQSYGDDQTIDVHLSWLRRKLGETAARPRYLHTLRGVGVKLEPPASGAAAMRWALVKVCLAVTAMVVVAFAVPLGLVIKEMARDRAFSNAERQAAAIAPALSITTDRDQLERVVAIRGLGLRAHGRAHTRGRRHGDGRSTSARQRAADEDIATVRKLGRASTTEVARRLRPAPADRAQLRRDRRRRGVRPRGRGQQRRRHGLGWCSPASASR